MFNIYSDFYLFSFIVALERIVFEGFSINFGWLFQEEIVSVSDNYFGGWSDRTVFFFFWNLPKNMALTLFFSFAEDKIEKKN